MTSDETGLNNVSLDYGSLGRDSHVTNNGSHRQCPYWIFRQLWPHIQFSCSPACLQECLCKFSITKLRWDLSPYLTYLKHVHYPWRREDFSGSLLDFAKRIAAVGLLAVAATQLIEYRFRHPESNSSALTWPVEVIALMFWDFSCLCIMVFVLGVIHLDSVFVDTLGLSLQNEYPTLESAALYPWKGLVVEPWRDTTLSLSNGTAIPESVELYWRVHEEYGTQLLNAFNLSS